MGLTNFFKKNLGLENEDYETEEEMNEVEEKEDFFDEPAPEEVSEKPQAKKARKNYSNSITLGGNERMEFVVVKPKDFGDECTGIAEHMLDKKTVVLNLETTSKEASRRIIDFVSGVAFAVKAKIKKVATCTYVIVPDNSDFTGEESYEAETEAEITEENDSGFSF